jgi:hypothetical protein
MYEDQIYYEDQTDWKPADFYGLWRYLNRLFQYAGPTPAQAANPDHYSSRIQAKKTGKRDEELAALDPSRMSEDTRYLAKHLLVSMKRDALVYDRFPNLRPLQDVGELGHKIFLDAKPTLVNEYFTSVGIYL